MTFSILMFSHILLGPFQNRLKDYLTVTHIPDEVLDLDRKSPLKGPVIGGGGSVRYFQNQAVSC